MAYPDCPPLSSGTAELTAFVVHLGLVAGCIRDGHTRECAERLVWHDAESCVCGAEEYCGQNRGKKEGANG